MCIRDSDAHVGDEETIELRPVVSGGDA